MREYKVKDIQCNQTFVIEFQEIINELNTHFEEHKTKAHRLVEAKKSATKKGEAEMITKAAQDEIAKAGEYK